MGISISLGLVILHYLPLILLWMGMIALYPILSIYLEDKEGNSSMKLFVLGLMGSIATLGAIHGLYHTLFHNFIRKK